MSDVLRYEQCPKCREAGRDRSGDNLAVYSDEPKNVHCFACGYNYDEEGLKRNGMQPRKKKGGSNIKWFISDEYKPIPGRKIGRETCRKFGVQVFNNGVAFNYYDDKGGILAQHVRRDPKKFTWKLGDVEGAKELPLFGQNLWRPNPKLTVTVTEGEIDALSISQMQDNKWPVVSVPNGASGAEAAVKKNFEFLNGFKEVVLCFDNDEAGQEAAAKCAELFAPGKCRVTTLPRKDANEMWVAGELRELQAALLSAKEVRPDGVLSIKDIAINRDAVVGDIYDYPFPRLTDRTLGRRAGELLIVTAGSGSGKTTFIKECMYNDLLQGRRVGILMLEEGTKDTKLDLAGLRLNKPVRRRLVIDTINKVRATTGAELIESNVPEVSDEELSEALGWLDSQPLFLYDHFGSMDSQILLNKIRYMIQGLECDVIYLDHISIVISGQDTGNERIAIDNLMTELRSLVEQTDVHMTVISHLRKKNGQSHEEGGAISSDDLRGSGALKQLSDGILGLERDQQSTEEGSGNLINIRSCKDRFAGTTGVLTTLKYQEETGRLVETELTAPTPEEEVSREDLFD